MSRRFLWPSRFAVLSLRASASVQNQPVICNKSSKSSRNRTIFGLGSLNNAQATSSYGDSSSISPLQPKLDEALARLEAERERRIEMERRIVHEREEFEQRMQEKLAAQRRRYSLPLRWLVRRNG